MTKMYEVLGSILTLILTGIGIFVYGINSGKKKKENEILKESVEDALETKKREELRNHDSIDDVVKRLRNYANK